jgi:predicted deacetylase
MPMTRRGAARRVIVSLHDVAPPFEGAIRAQLALLASVGVRRVALKVTPNWHGAYPLDGSPSLVALLHEQIAAGSEIVLHGFEHCPADNRPFRGPWLSRTRARLFARDAAEFLTLSADEAGDALRRGVAAFERAGLPRPTMFCAPGWLHNKEAEAALKREGFRYLIDMFVVRDLWDRRGVWTPAVGYMGAGPRQELGVQILNGIVRQAALRTASVAKVYLHPQGDPTGVIVRRRVAALAEMIERDGWRPATFAEVCGDGDA